MTNIRMNVLMVFVCLGCTQGMLAQPVDILIRNGKIVDGTGNPWFYGDLAIRGDRIAAIGKLADRQAGIEIDAEGLIVCPGFIDIHSHSDRTFLEDGTAQSKVRQGVTTEVMGEGDSGGPYQGQLPPRQAIVNGQTREWTTLKGFLDALEEAGISTNACSYVGINNLWRSAMGDSHDRPTPQQMQLMKELLDEGMREGALGLSSQVMFTPGSLATTDDLVELCTVVARYGGIYSTHIRNEGTGVFDSVKEAIEIGERAGVAVDVIHLKISDQQHWGRMAEIVDLIETARRRGVNVQANVYPYTRGNNNLVNIIPPWAHAGGKEMLLERLADPKLRDRLKRDIQEGLPGWYNHYTAVGRDWSRMLVAANNRFQGLTMDRVMSIRTQDRPDADLLDEMIEFVLEEQGSVSTVFAHHTQEDMQRALVQPWCSVGSDGSGLSIEGTLRRGNPHPRNFGTFPRVLGRYVREQKLLPLEEAIGKMTSMNASKIGIRERGQLVEGFYADITVFDPETVMDRATYTEPFQYPVGIEHVIVNGTFVLRNGEHTSARPGRAVYRQ